MPRGLDISLWPFLRDTITRDFVVHTPRLHARQFRLLLIKHLCSLAGRCIFFKPEHERDFYMKSFRTELASTFTGRNEETQLLNNVCKKIGLSEVQKQHLLARVFFDPHALTYWIELHRKDASRAESYLLNLVPPRGAERATLFDRWWLKWLAPIARATGLLS